MQLIDSIKKFNLSKYKGELLYSVSSYCTPIAAMTTSFIAAMFLTPTELGTISSVLLILPYIAFLHFGVFNGLGRNLAFYKAQNEDEKVQKLVDASFTVAKLNSVVGAVIGFGILAYFIVNNYAAIYIFSSILLICNVSLTSYTSHFDVTFRSGQHFKKLGQILLIENSLYLLSSVLPCLIGYIGRIISIFLRISMMFLLRLRYHPYIAKKKGEWKEIKELSSVGIPMFISTYLWGILVVSDQSLITHFLGVKELGHYALSTTLITAMMFVPQSINVLLYPKASAQYGITKSNRGLRSFYWKAIFINLIMLLLICSVVFIFIEPFTKWVLPQYISGIPAAKINILTCLTMISTGPNLIIFVTRRNKPLIAAYLLTLGIIWLSGFMLPIEYLTLENIAWIRFVASALLCIFVLVYSYYLTCLDDFRK